MKRRLVVNACDTASSTGASTTATASVSSVPVEKRGCQIRPLGADPSFQTLTPRSLAKSVAELDALRSRVHALELQLSQQNEAEAALLLLSAQGQKSVKKLPPLGDGALVQGEANEESTTSLPIVSLSSHLATAPEHSNRRKFSLTLPSAGSSPVKQQSHMNSTAPSQPLMPVDQQRLGQSQSADTLQPLAASSSLSAEGEKQKSMLQGAGLSHSSTKRLIISRSFTGLTTECSGSSASPPREETKITLSHDGGDATFAVSQRNRLYQILKRVSAIVAIKEDEVRLTRYRMTSCRVLIPQDLYVLCQLVILKKLVDAEIGDVIKFLVDLEHEDDLSVISKKLAHLLKTGSPSKHHTARVELLHQHPIWGIQYPLQKIACNLEHLRSTVTSSSPTASSSSSPSKRTEVIVLVSSGAYNPIHMLHIRAFYVARQYVESNYKFPVVGAFISPSHDTYVRVKNRRNPREMITKRHRLGLIEAAVASSTWIEVDKWEITRRRVLDYLSTLTHVREMCDSHFPGFKFHLMYVCGCNTVVKLSHSALREEGFGCITICRPTQTEMVIKHLGKQLAKATTIVEDTGVLPCDLERATSFRVRKALTNIEKNGPLIEMMVGKSVFQYFVKHDIGAKIAGKENWTDEDKQWRDVDLPYVEYIES